MSPFSSSFGPMILNIPYRLQDSEHQILGVYRSWYERTLSDIPEHIPVRYLNIHLYFLSIVHNRKINQPLGFWASG